MDEGLHTEGDPAMRWLMVSQDTQREAIGGTELYVLRLAEALIAEGVAVAWVHYCDGEPGLVEDNLRGNDIDYFRITARHHGGGRELAWQIEPIGLDEFREVLRRIQPDCVHFHGFGRNQSPEHFAAAKQSGAKVFMTYHSPGQSCARWDLLYKGREMCTGEIDVTRCTDCCLHRIGVPEPVRSVLARVDVSNLARLLPYSAQHPLARRKGIKDYQCRWNEGMAIPDKILWHAEWVRDLLLRNGISEERLQHLPLPPPRPADEGPIGDKSGTTTRKFLYIGRLSDIKGVHVITEAVRLLPLSADIEVQIIGAKGPEEYFRRIARGCESDPRLRLMPPIPFDEIPCLMRAADAVIVPSLWPETGPYTVLEALWTGTPVIGSDRAGIRELLKAGGGLLFEPGNSQQLARLLVECDFRAMRCNPIAFQSNWKGGFSERLDALCGVLSGTVLTGVSTHDQMTTICLERCI